jgi:flagellar hook protein FlgE
MLRSMYAGVSGLRSHQTMMDVIGNNIANVNTTGFKASSVTFQDTLSQMIGGAGAPQNTTGGTNPSQVGLGVRLSSISTNFSQGASQLTGRTTDLAIQGDGMFVARGPGGENLYTRQGAFSFDTNGRLVTPQGAVIQGWMANGNGAINTNAPIGNLELPVGQLLQPRQTDIVKLGGNLPADAEEGVTITTAINVFDSRGTSVPVSMTFTKTATGWDIEGTTPDVNNPGGDPVPVALSQGSITFDAEGRPQVDDIAFTFGPASGEFSGPVTVALGTSSPDGLQQWAGMNSVNFTEQDGYGVGFLRSFSISPSGVMTGVFSNGQTRSVGQIAVATFNNPQGLEKSGDSMYRMSVNSGIPQIGVAGNGGRGTLAGGMLEMSNVDLAQEFTNLIVAQRGFQANSRIITASDELLQDLVNLKR